eukprot:TRINITY_DN24779_c0_g1_i1.p1 TRINITY_DN24779_c0_g1~~TRINITY_DN24779_c0_g1_i1.p1  ORF type:complete len:220 (+),score=74.41 TRINITY_DN24779_c0_g1_i1:73-732(+)
MKAAVAAAVLSLIVQRGAAVSKEAVAHVACAVCELAVEEASKYIKENAIIDEDGVADVVDGLCSVKRKEGRWCSSIDITRDDAALSIEKQGSIGECRNECLTAQRACQQALKDKEEDLVGLLLKGSAVKDLKKKICKKICKKKLPKLGKWTDEEFKARDAKEVETEDMIAKMKADTGMGMKMYKREDLMSMSEGDMETMAAREAFASERQAAKLAEKEL